MKIIKISIVICLSLFYSGCLLTRSYNIDHFENLSIEPEYEITNQNYSGKCLYSPENNKYYTKKLLKGSRRIVAISTEDGYHALIEELNELPKIQLLEVPFIITDIKDKYKYIQQSNGIIVFRDIDDLPPPSYSVQFGSNSSSHCTLNVKSTYRNSLAYQYKRLGYFITVPLDIVTSPFQFLFCLFITDFGRWNGDN